MATPLDVATVTAAVRKHGGIDRAKEEAFPDVSYGKFRRFCKENDISFKGAVQAETTTLGSPPPPIIQPPKVTYRIAQKRPDGLAKIRVLAIGDAHDSPTLPDKSRFYWMGKYAAEHKPDVVLSIGDLCSLDSLCSYDRNDTLRGKHKPSFKQDMASAKEALAAFDEGLGNFKPEKHVTLGNHEDRIFSFTNRTPEIAEMLDENLHTVLTDFGWHYSPYGAMHYIGGVGFTHVPFTVMGKPFGGENSENQIGNRAVCDVVYGHTHKKVEKPYWKVGGERITVLNLGSALPHGHVEPYAKHSLGDGNWDYGVFDLTIEQGRLKKSHHIPMTDLGERYGH